MLKAHSFKVCCLGIIQKNLSRDFIGLNNNQITQAISVEEAPFLGS
jgi:hypothetical protein